MSSRVFVPLVGADGSAQQLFEALASADPPEAHPAKLIAQISELHDFGLYRIGQTVREAVMRFTEARREKVWLGRRNARTEPWHLRISELQVGRLSDENARSAGLGLTVAALLRSFDMPAAIVFATGEVSPSQDPSDPGTKVVAVDGIRGKLSLVGDYMVAHRATLAGRPIHLLLPSKAVDGRPLAEVEARSLARLKAAADDAGLDLRTTMLDGLDQIETVFGPFSLEPLIGRGAAAGIAAVVLGTGLLLAGWSWLANAPVHLSWLTMDGDQAAGAEPQRARYVAATDKLEILPSCFDDQRQPVVLGGETLLLRVTAREDRPFASLVAPPRFFIASVSRAADPVVLDASLFRTAGEVRPGALTEAVAAVPVEPTEDEIRLFVVATRDSAVDLSTLTEELRQRLAGTEGASALASATQILKDRFDGLIDYQFRVTTDASRCP